MLQIKTETIQDMVNKASRCVSNNKLIPITSLINVKVKDHILTLTTTDATNYFYVTSSEKFDSDDFEVSILADLFIKLIQKTTSDTVSLSLDNNVFIVKGNGTYSLELILDENSSPVKFPVKYDVDAFRNDLGVIKLSTVNTILNYNKASLSAGSEIPALASYYCGGSVVTSDRYKVCSTNIKVFDEPKLLTSRLMDILSIMSSEDIQISATDDDLLFFTSTETLYSPIIEGIDTFPIDTLNKLISSDFPSTCKIPRVAILDVLDRLSLFVSPYDKKGINLTFTKEGLQVSSKKSSGIELIPYVTSEKFNDYSCCIDVEFLRSQVATQSDDNIELSYGSDIAIKITSGNIVQLVALMPKEV